MRRLAKAVGWIMAGVVLAVIAGLIEPNMAQTELGRWVRETGFPALERLVKGSLANPLALLASPWAPWIGGLIAVALATVLGRHFLGRPRWPSEYKADLRLASKLEARAEKREKAAAECRALIQEWNRLKFSEATRKSLIGIKLPTAIATTNLPLDLHFEFHRRRIKVDPGEVSLTPEWLEANARCWRKIASALRKGTYKGKTFHVQPYLERQAA